MRSDKTKAAANASAAGATTNIDGASMQRLQTVSPESKYLLTEPFASELPDFLRMLEREWQQTSLLMDAQLQALFKEAHRTLGLLHEELNVRQTARVA
jgi:hypothetical protein